MKIIDLLNKIANGEEVPKRIIYDQFVYVWNSKIENYQREVDEITTLNWDYITINCLNEPVEILNRNLKEEKKIPEKLDIRQEKNIKNNWKWKVYGKEHSYNISTPQKIIADKVNEICDYLESKGDE